ncbi:hypothetical protein ACSV4D_18110 [Flavobacterium sp. ARAG 55.4]|uniref:hypothetical protein n=1 Tax=Flavobacterium sp. ARAG 55.4 TaxID=3451357 RepID=UPI003F483CC3
MTSKEFAQSFYEEKEFLMDIYFERKIIPYAEYSPKSDVAELIKKLDLNSEDNESLKKIIDGALRDVCYTILVGLDGGTSIGNGLQQIFELRDENGNELSGDLEGYAYEYFYEE